MSIRVVAAALIRDGKVLAARRAPQAARGGLWELPGGKVEPGESDADALVRELREELGVSVSVNAFLAESTHAYPDVTITLAAWSCSIRSGALTPREHDAIRWVSADDLHRLDWAPADVPLLAAVADRLEPSRLKGGPTPPA